ncbi:unnamed protein product, partial [Iphiclides podalirius]
MNLTIIVDRPHQLLDIHLAVAEVAFHNAPLNIFACFTDPWVFFPRFHGPFASGWREIARFPSGLGSTGVVAPLSDLAGPTAAADARMRRATPPPALRRGVTLSLQAPRHNSPLDSVAARANVRLGATMETGV